VRYFLANSPTVEADAAADSALVEVGSTPESPDVVDGSASAPAGTKPEWVLYLIRDSQLVVPLHYEPVVESGLSKTQWQTTTAVTWYQNPRYWPVPIVSGGPTAWPHAKPGTLLLPGASRRVPPTTVSRVTYTDSTVSFDVGRLGVPVLVKVPYFPNWSAQGALGPFEATPNLMVVVPVAHHVVLSYKSTAIDWVGRIASVVGLAGLAAVGRFGTAGAPASPASGPASTPIAPGEGTGPEPGNEPADAADADEASFDPWKPPPEPQ
jgi:hypothetical protein